MCVCVCLWLAQNINAKLISVIKILVCYWANLSAYLGFMVLQTMREVCYADLLLNNHIIRQHGAEFANYIHNWF